MEGSQKEGHEKLDKSLSQKHKQLLFPYVKKLERDREEGGGRLWE